MADMFGSPIGVIASDANYRANIKSDLDTAASLNDLSLFPLKKRGAEIKIEEAETELKNKKAFQEIVARSSMTAAAEGKPVDVAARLDLLAGETAKAGLVNKAADLAKAAADIRSKGASAAAQTATKQLNELRLVREGAELMGQILGSPSITDEKSWQAANALYQLQTGAPSPFAQVPYSPELITRLNEASLSAKERADIESRRLTREATEEYRRAQLGNARLSHELARERLEAQREERARKAKGGAGPMLTGPTEEERGEVKRQLRLSGIDTTGLNSDSVNSVAYNIASRAKELQQANRALGRGQALAQAVGEARSSGELDVVIEGQKEVPLTGIKFGGDKKFKGKADKAKPITQPLPPDRNNLQTGTVYQTARGPAKYLGNGRFATVGQ